MKTSRNILLLHVLSCGTLMGQSWVHLSITDSIGVRPSLRLDAQDLPMVAFANPSLSRPYVYLATWNSGLGNFDIETAFVGGDPYVSLVLDQAQGPHITQHVHTFGGELVHHYKDAGDWKTEVIAHVGHDGWSNSPQFDSQDRLHVSTIDPACCSGQGLGVEYQWYDGTVWQHEIIGSESDLGPWTGTSLVLDTDDNPKIAYYDKVRKDLMLAQTVGGEWVFDTVDSQGDVGWYPSLQLDASGEPVIAYYEALSDTTGSIKLARHSISGWTLATIDTLNNMAIVPSPGRISLVLDSDDECHISYCDEKVLRYAIVSETATEIETIIDFTQQASLVGWTTSLCLDSLDQPHVAYWTEIGGEERCMYSYKPPPPPPRTNIRINTGGAAYTTRIGETFIADQKYAVGSFGYVGGIARPLRKPIEGTEDDRLYQAYRDGEFSYLFDVPNGSYDITCHFAEPSARAVGHRVFDILVENTLAVDNHDIFGMAGDRWVANTISFSVDVNDSQLQLVFVKVSVKGTPILSAIEVVSSVLEPPGARGDDGRREENKALETPPQMALFGNYPNPFNPSTTFRYGLSEPGQISLNIYNMLGQLVRTVVKDYQVAGFYEVAWDGRNETGATVSSGIYVYRMVAGTNVETRKMLLMK